MRLPLRVTRLLFLSVHDPIAASLAFTLKPGRPATAPCQCVAQPASRHEADAAVGAVSGLIWQGCARLFLRRLEPPWRAALGRVDRVAEVLHPSLLRRLLVLLRARKYACAVVSVRCMSGACRGKRAFCRGGWPDDLYGDWRRRVGQRGAPWTVCESRRLPRSAARPVGTRRAVPVQHLTDLTVRNSKASRRNVCAGSPGRDRGSVAHLGTHCAFERRALGAGVSAVVAVGAAAPTVILLVADVFEPH